VDKKMSGSKTASGLWRKTPSGKSPIEKVFHKLTYIEAAFS